MKKQEVNSVERTYRELWKGLGERIMQDSPRSRATFRTHRRRKPERVLNSSFHENKS